MQLPDSLYTLLIHSVRCNRPQCGFTFLMSIRLQQMAAYFLEYTPHLIPTSRMIFPTDPGFMKRTWFSNIGAQLESDPSHRRQPTQVLKTEEKVIQMCVSIFGLLSIDCSNFSKTAVILFSVLVCQTSSSSPCTNSTAILFGDLSRSAGWT